MNAGKDYVKALEHAQANANRSGEAWVLHNYNGVWWINRLSTFTDRTPPDGATVVHPTNRQ